ncbi:TonB-dependent receptor [Sphingobium sp. AN641]|uniref:TonB-dependent receptor n=1 Tax=Sphingobium sp. AN641 TaxID=3133443 RepID=UPI0030BB65E2
MGAYLKSAMMSGTAIAILSTAPAALAQARNFDIPSQAASQAILQFAKQAGVQIVVPGQRLRGKRTNEIKGNLDVRSALRTLISPTDLRVVSDNGGVIVLAMAQPPRAQSDPAPIQATGSADSETPEPSGEIVVTGSRIARRDLDTPAPRAVVSDAEFKQSGAINVESVMNALPQIRPSNTGFYNGPSVATLDLRGLGTNRNLVLVNGRRYMFYNTSQVTDLNTIPQFLIQGVDVVTGGASAVYGSDAIAGVVNFRLRTNLRGLEIGGQNSISGKGDGHRFEAHVAMGTEFAEGRGHITLYGEYYKRKPIFQTAREFSSVALGDNADKTGFFISGSSTVPSGRFTALGNNAFAAGTLFNNLTLGGTFPTPGANARAYTGADAYNPASSSYLMTPQERWLGGGYGEYEISDHAKAYMEVSYVNNRVAASLAPTPFGGSFLVNLSAAQNYLSPTDYATLSAIGARQAAAGYTFTSQNGQNYTVGANPASNGANQIGLSVSRRSEEAGLRQVFDDRKAFRALGGLSGKIAGDWTYDAYYMYARTRNSQVQYGNLSQRAIQAGLLDGTVNLFGAGTLTPSAVDAISIRTNNRDISTLQVANGSIQGKLFNIGWGADDVALVVGGEYRKVRSEYIPDLALSSGDSVGLPPGKATAGGYNIKEAFFELSVPIAAHSPFVERLEVDARGRYSKYSLGAVGGVWTYAFGAQYAPVRDITFRAQYSRAVRAPNVGELFGGAGSDSAIAQDPCALAANANSATIRALCIATGVPAASIGSSILQPNATILGTTGGNPNLQEEKSTSYTFGAVIRPRWIPRLNVTVDYFNINVKDAIAPVGGGVANILNLCYNTIQDANSAICRLIRRNPTTGVIDAATGPNGSQNTVLETQANLGFYKTSGVDIAADYTQPLDFGIGTSQSQLNLSVAATWTQKFDIQPISGLSTLECAGRFGLTCGNPLPHWRTTTRLSFINGPATLSLKWLHYGPVRDDSATVFTVERMHSYDKFDLSASVDINERATITAGINNLANAKPPAIGGFNMQQGNTWPNTYDVLARDFFLSMNVRF